MQAVYWIETKGKTLEEIDEIFDGQKHSNVPDVAAVRAGVATVDVEGIERELHGVYRQASKSRIQYRLKKVMPE